MSLLLERERELDRLGGRLDAARGGDGGLVVVEGAPGLGKTSVVRAVVVEAQQRGFVVARARGAELWSVSGRSGSRASCLSRRCGVARLMSEPSCWRGAAGLAAHVVLPELASGAVEVDASFGTLHGLYWLCANLAARQPLLLAVDDAQWADEASLRFLGVLVRRLDALAVLVLLARRPTPVDELAALAG